MLFRSVASLFAGALFIGGALAALTPADVVTNIGIVTQVSGNLNSVLGGLSTSTRPAQVKTMSQTVGNDFNTIISNLAAYVTALQATPSFSNADAGPVVDALRTFVGVHQALLSTVIGKHSIFAQFFLTAPIAAVLRSLKAGIDSFAFAMIDLIPTKSSDVTGFKNDLDNSVGNTITLYEQLCIPSPLYPGIPPVCIAL